MSEVKYLNREDEERSKFHTVWWETGKLVQARYSDAQYILTILVE
jgi:hypothetical protein